MRFTFAAFSLAGAATLASASMHQASPKAHALAARSIDVSVHKNDPRTLCLLNGLLGGGLGGCGVNKPSSSWQCSGSGYDGYDYDHTGAKCPSHFPGGWKWFGTSVGWAPPRGWGVPSYSWQLPSLWIPKISLCTWWSPPVQWTCPPSVKPPQWWPQPPAHPPTTTEAHPPATTEIHPAPEPTPSPPQHPEWPGKEWECDGSGNDGKDYDWEGKTCPFPGLPFKWFGVKLGWLPSKGWWGVGDDYKFPSTFFSNCGKATWWAPSSSWKHPVGFSIPSFWINLGWKSYLWPSSSWTCNKSGQDGWNYDHMGNGRPSGIPSEWKYFGLGPQWQPCLGWKVPSYTWKPPGSWSPKHAVWWKPSTKWQLPHGYSCPSWWPTSLLSFLKGGILSWFGW